MNIETRFGIGDYVFTMQNNRLHRCCVKKINISVDSMNKVSLCYEIRSEYGLDIDRHDNELFNTKLKAISNLLE